MVEMRDLPKINETDSIIEEYRRRISDALESERIKLIEQAEREAKELVARAHEEAGQIINEAHRKTQDEGARMVLQAEQKAEAIIRDAERRSQEEAKERTRREIERILARARDDAEKAAARITENAKKEASVVVAKASEDVDLLSAQVKESALKEAKKEGDLILEKSRSEAEQHFKEASEKAVEEAKKQSLRIIREAEQIAGQITAEAASLGVRQGKEQVNQLLNEIRKTVAADLKVLLADVTLKVDGLIVGSLKEMKEEVPAQEAETPPNAKGRESLPEQSRKEPSLGRLFGKTLLSDPKTESDQTEIVDTRLYEGLLNLEILHPVDVQQLLTLRKGLFAVSGLHLVSTGGSVGKNVTKTVYTINIKSPLPLLKILREMPPVDSVIPQKKQDIAIKLK